MVCLRAFTLTVKRKKRVITKTGTRKVYGKSGTVFKEKWIQLFIYKINLSCQQHFPTTRMELSVIPQQKIACWILTAAFLIVKKAQKAVKYFSRDRKVL